MQLPLAETRGDATEDAPPMQALDATHTPPATTLPAAAGTPSLPLLPPEQRAARRWYFPESRYVTYSEFRSSPMGRDMLAGGTPPGEGRQQQQQHQMEGPEAACEWAFSILEDEASHAGRAGHWDLQEMHGDTGGPPQSALQRAEAVVTGVVKFCAIWGVLYLFILSLGVMGSAFQIVGGRSSGQAFRDSALIGNPLSGLAIGVLATVMMQSSSTTTSIVISMAAAGLISVRNASYLVMGANIGTSVTNTLVSVAHLNSPAEYRRAFTGAVFHDMFNWLTVGIFLPLEVTSGFLDELAGQAVKSLGITQDSDKSGKVDFLKKITHPATGRVVSIDKKMIAKIAEAASQSELDALEGQTMIKQHSGHVLRDAPISDASAGILLVVVSLTMLTTCLLLLVKLLQSVLKGRVAVWTRYLLNIEFQHPALRACGGLDGYILLLFGTGCTILVQSSSVFTSTLTPLVGIGLIHVEKVVALTHGANIGTTVTGVLSALSGDNLEVGLRVALEHVFFNCLGTFLWFVVWPLRATPLNMAKFMGTTAANLRWFPLAYIVAAFLLCPLLIVGLVAAGGNAALAGVGAPLLATAFALGAWVWVRRNRADLLPRSGAMSLLRAPAAPCGWRYPNSMQLWGGDTRADQVDVSELRRKEDEAQARSARVRPWPQAPAVWGLALLSLLAVLLALPTSQWRRVRYAEELRGRPEVGLGLRRICSESYTQSHGLPPAPPACDADLLLSCAAPLAAACADPSWAATPDATHPESALYASAFRSCSQLGCRARGWVDACTALPSCSGRAYHAARCGGAVSSYAWFHERDMDSAVRYTWGEGGGGGSGSGMPELFASAAEGGGQAASERYPLQAHRITNHGTGRVEQPRYGGVAPSPAAGTFLAVTARGCDADPAWTPMLVELAVAVNYTSAEVLRSAQILRTAPLLLGGRALVSLPNRAGEAVPTPAGCTPYGNLPVDASGVALTGLALLDEAAGLYIASDAFGPKLVVFDTAGTVHAVVAPAGSGYEGPGVAAVLPQVYAGAGQFGCVAVSPGREVHACLKSTLLPVSGNTTTGLEADRAARCVSVGLQSLSAPVLLSQKVALQSRAWLSLQQADSGCADGYRTSVMSCAWTKAGTLLAVEEVSAVPGPGCLQAPEPLYVAQTVDLLASGTALAGLHANTTTLEQLLEADAEAQTLRDAGIALKQHAVAGATRQHAIAFAEAYAGFGTSYAAFAAANTHTLAAIHSPDTSAASIDLLQMPAGLPLAEPGDPTPDNSSTFPAGDACRDIGEVCPGGDLQGDMAVLEGLAASGTACLGIGLALVIFHTMVPHHRRADAKVGVAALCFVVAWVLLLAAWAHLEATLTQKTYTCYFEDESLRGGMVLVTGELGVLFMPSYSWAFCILSWGFLSIATAFLLCRALPLLCGGAPAGKATWADLPGDVVDRPLADTGTELRTERHPLQPGVGAAEQEPLAPLL